MAKHFYSGSKIKNLFKKFFFFFFFFYPYIFLFKSSGLKKSSFDLTA